MLDLSQTTIITAIDQQRHTQTWFDTLAIQGPEWESWNCSTMYCQSSVARSETHTCHFIIWWQPPRVSSLELASRWCSSLAQEASWHKAVRFSEQIDLGITQCPPILSTVIFCSAKNLHLHASFSSFYCLFCKFSSSLVWFSWIHVPITRLSFADSLLTLVAMTINRRRNWREACRSSRAMWHARWGFWIILSRLLPFELHPVCALDDLLR